MEDCVPVALGRLRLLLVHGCDFRRQARLEQRRLALVRLLQWNRRHAGDDRVGLPHRLLARPLSQALLRGVRLLTGQRVELITIGDELLLGFTIDTNAAHISRVLAAAGVEIVRRTTVGDVAEAITSAVTEALDRTGAVITTGGLGPTSDDMTKPAIAAIFGRKMKLDEEISTLLEKR